MIAITVAASIGCGSLMSASASISSGDRSVYVPITPCRVLDTRPAPETIGARSTPLTGGETHTITVLGSNGQCTVPVDASAVAMNVTAVNATIASFLTVFPADATRPLASSLNWVAGQGATPNAVTSDVSADGKVSFFNNAGSVDVVADIVGYFVDHNHDDRYYTKSEIEARDYTKSEIDAKLASKADKVTGVAGTVVIGSAAFVPAAGGFSYSIDPSNSGISGLNGALCFNATVALPTGATVTALRLDGFDNVGNDLFLNLLVDPFGSTNATLMANTSSVGISGVVTVSDVTISNALINNAANAYSLRLCHNVGLFFYDARIDYTTP